MALTKVTYSMIDSAPINVLDLGADPTGVNDSTAAIAAALTASVKIYIPAGTYLVTQIDITQSGTQIITDGMGTIIKQKAAAGGNLDLPIIRVIASNVIIGDLRFIGNIATDTGEWNHCLYVHDNSGLLPEIRNITLGNYYATDIRGDVIYIGGVAATPVYDVNVASIDGDNIFRSICSVTGAQGVRIQQIYGNRVGYRNIDFESNIGSQKIDDCWVGFVRGGCIQLASDSAALRVGSIQIDQLDLDNAYMPAPTPHGVFTNPSGPDTGVLCSRFDYFKIGSLKLNGYATVGIIISDLPAEDKGRIIIDHLEATNIAPTGSYQCVIESSGATLVEINSGKITLASGTSLLKGLDADYTIRNIEFIGTVNASIASNCTDLYCENVTGNFGNSALFGGVGNGQVINSRFETTGYAMHQCIDMSWYNCTLDSGDFDHSPGAGSHYASFDRGTLNGTWYDHYSYIPGSSSFGNFVGVLTGNGSPEGVVYANIGTLYARLDGGVNTTLYVKQANNAAPTGWAAK